MDQQQLFVKMAMQGWQVNIRRADDLFNKLPEERFLKEVAPGRNTGIYLLGHLIAVHDRMLPLLGLGEVLYPQLEKPFLATPDKSGLDFPALPELKHYWAEVNKKLEEGFNTMSPEEWFQRHTAVPVEEFANEPHRNKLNILLNRTSHLSYHLGQLVLLK
jgi:DinB family protein